MNHWDQLHHNREDSPQALAEPASDPGLPLPKNNALLVGYYGARNLGDELMLACLHRWLTAQGFAVTVLCEDAGQVKQLHGFKAVRNYPLLGQFGAVESFLRGKAAATLRNIARADLVLAGGGDIIRDAIGWRAFSYQVEKFIAALLLRKPVYLLNVGITEPVTWYGKTVLRWLLPRCRKIIVREARSLDLCRRFGAQATTLFAPDIVMRLPDLFPVSAQPASLPYVLIALRGNPNVYGQYDLSAPRLQNLAQALDALVETYHCDLHFLACQSGEGDAHDHYVHRQIVSRMKHSGSTQLLDWTVDPQQIANHFGRSRIVVAMRLHAAVLASAFAKPCVLMPYDHKVEEFGKQASMTNLLSASTLDKPSEIETSLAEAMMEPGSAFQPPVESSDWMRLSLDRS